MTIPKNDPIVVAPTPTPFSEDDNVDHDALSHNIQRWLETPLTGFVLGTATGEELALSEVEKIEIVRTVSQVSEGKRLIIAGIDNPSTSETLRLAHCYSKAGADLIRVRVPRRMQPSVIRRYFEKVASRSPVPVIVIHQTFTHESAASPKVIGGICRLDNVFGYITGGNIHFEARVRRHVPQERRFWICNGGLLLYGMLMGATGACMWLGNIAPTLCLDILQFGLAKRFDEGLPLQAKASYLDEAIGMHGVAGVKMALSFLGYRGKRTRIPHSLVGKQDRAEIEASLEKAGLLK